MVIISVSWVCHELNILASSVLEHGSSVLDSIVPFQYEKTPGEVAALG